MTSYLIKNIFTSQTSFEGINEIDKLTSLFTNLYRINLFKDGLDLVLTKLQQQQLSFEVKIIKDWDTNVGCFLTTQQGFFDRTLGKVFHKKTLKIILRQISYNVLAHEMAHAIDYESGINLKNDFQKYILFDMKNCQTNSITLRSEAKRLLIDAVKLYPKHQILAELFARYFELLSTSRDVCHNGSFLTLDVLNYFANTTKFISGEFNQQIKKHINPNIALHTSEIIKNLQSHNMKQEFSQQTKSFHKKTFADGTKSWSQNTKSNSSYQQAWDKYKTITNNTDNK